MQTAGYITSTKFRDADNTAYYLDPSSTSTSLNVAGNVNAGGSILGQGNLNLRAYNNTGQGIFFRDGFEYGDGSPYNLSITILNDGDGSSDALEINAFDGIYMNTGSNSQNVRWKISSTGAVTNYNTLEILDKTTIKKGQVWDATTQGTGTGSLHIDPELGTDSAGGAITFGASDSGSGETAQAGIYIRSDGSYGTRMYFATTDSYATGSKTAMNILQNGQVNITRNNLIVNSDVRAPIFYDSNNTGYYVNPASTSILNSVTLSSFTLDGNTISGIDDSGEFTDDDAHIMTSAGIHDKYSFASFTTVGGTFSYDDYSARGLYRFQGGTDGPAGGSHTTGFSVTENSGNYGFQLVSNGSDNNSEQLYYRYKGTTFGNWQTIVTKTFGDGRYLKLSGGTVSGNLTVTGNFTVNGTTTTVNQTNLDVSDNIIGLNRGASSNANDSGLIIERGSTGDNAAFLWDETADKFVFGTTTGTPASTGNVSFTAAAFGGKGLWTTTSAVTHWGPGVDGTAYGTLTWDTGYAAVHANGSNVLRLGSGSDTDAVIIDGSNMSVAGQVTATRFNADNNVAYYGKDSSGTHRRLIRYGTDNNTYIGDGIGELYFQTSGGQKKVWHQGNHGTGSGLDADLLDGNHASAFVTMTSDETISGRKTFSHADGVQIQRGGGTGNGIRILTENDGAQIADSFSANTSKSYIYFDARSTSNDPGYIMHETSSSETNEGVLHLVPSDDNSTGDYVSIHGTNDPDVLKLHTSGLVETVNLQLQLKSGLNQIYLNDDILVAGASTFSSNVHINGASGSSGNAFSVNRGSDGADAFRVQNSG